MPTARPLVTVIRAGRINYNTGLKLQKQLSNQSSDLVEKFRNYLVIQEFSPVYTIGIRTRDYNADEECRLKALGAEFFRTNRGGLITFHGPGQLVAYPILHLRQFQSSMRRYVGALEETVIDTCRSMGVADVTTTLDTGIWVGNNKICAIGVHGSRYVTTHGIGLNCCTDLKWFDHIVACGIEGKGVTSLSQELERTVSVAETTNVLVQSFATIFRCRIVEGKVSFDVADVVVKDGKECFKNSFK